MISPYLEKIKKGAMILEPSAGSGAILDQIQPMWVESVIREARERMSSREESDLRYYANKSYKIKAYCIEPDAELQQILIGKGYRVIGDDFMQYRGHYSFDLILMNPPFAQGDKHLLKAWNTIDEGDICCLLNRETLDNPHTESRQLLRRVIDQNGEVMYLGQCFKDSRHATDVDVAMVRLKKCTERKRFEFKWDRPKDRDFEEVDFNNQVAKADYLQALEGSFSGTVAALEEYIKAKEKLHAFAATFSGTYKGVGDALEVAYKNGKTKKEVFNIFIDEFKMQAWEHVFRKTKLSQVVTSGVKEDWEKNSKVQGMLEFTAENMDSLFELLFVNRQEIMERCLVEVFDRMTSYDKKNKIHWEGWKTNDAYKVNRKVIMPYYIKMDWSNRFEIQWRRKETLDDIDKVMCMLSGKRFENILTMESALKAKFSEIGPIGVGGSFDNKAESEFFRMKFWKKGTFHIEFLDESLWVKFNRTAAKGKNWLPGER